MRLVFGNQMSVMVDFEDKRINTPAGLGLTDSHDQKVILDVSASYKSHKTQLS